MRKTNLRKIYLTEQSRKLKAQGQTYKEIAYRFGVSRQYIQELLRAPIDIQNEKKKIGKCEICGNPKGILYHIHHNNYIDTDINNFQYLCINCHSSKKRKEETIHYCLECNRAITKGLFCNHICQNKYYMVTLICEYCGKIFERNYNTLKWDIIRQNPQHFYCSNECRKLKQIRHAKPKIKPKKEFKSKYSEALLELDLILKNNENTNLHRLLKQKHLPTNQQDWFKKHLKYFNPSPPIFDQK